MSPLITVVVLELLVMTLLSFYNLRNQNWS
jgi:hypothetical protein